MQSCEWNDSSVADEHRGRPQQARLVRERQAAFATVITAGVILCLLLFAALAIDISKTYLFRAQLQMVTDASALASVKGLPVAAEVRTAAKYYSGLNMPAGQYGNVVQPSSNSVILGIWDADARTFTPDATPANAVRVIGKATRSNGNAVAMYLGGLMGTRTIDITTSSIAMRIADIHCAFIGLSSADISGGSLTDSFDSSLGPQSIGGDKGTVCSNADITMNGQATIHGDAIPGKGPPPGTVTMHGGASVTGISMPDPDVLIYPPPNMSVVQFVNDNDSIGLTSSGKNPLDKSGNFQMASGDTITLAPGNYYFDKMTVTGNSTLVITGPTKIYTTGQVDFTGGTMINTSEIPANLRIESTGDVTLAGQNDLYAVIYAPTQTVKRTGGAGFYGSIVSDHLKLGDGGNGDAGDHYDIRLGLGETHHIHAKLVE